MKQCPKCGNSYTDDTLSFCLADGTALTVADEQPTVFRGGDPNKTEQLPYPVTTPGHEQMRVTIPGAPNATNPYAAPQAKKSRSTLWTFLIAAVLLGVAAVIAIAGVLGFLYYVGSRQTTVAVNTQYPSPTPRNLPSATPDEEKSNLNDEVERLKKKLEEAARSNSNTEIVIDENDLDGFGKTAKVNSPKDGFLALRNLPSTDIGERVAKIPHGATIKIIMCSDQSVTIGDGSGHWCMATYQNHTGWVFDRWLEFQSSSKE